MNSDIEQSSWIPSLFDRVVSILILAFWCQAKFVIPQRGTGTQHVLELKPWPEPWSVQG
jgi:hypothetical protein